MPFTVDAAFPGGACKRVLVEGDQVSFDAPRNGCPQPLWFSLRVRGGRGRKLNFVLRNGGECLGAATLTACQPVLKEAGGDWTRLHRPAARYDAARGELHFTAAPGSDETYLAFCYPYQLGDLEPWLMAIDEHPHAAVVPLGESEGGHAIWMVGITNQAAPGRKRLVWVTARQHAGETPSSFVVEGLIDELLSDRLAALRDEYAFCLMPMMDVDAVEFGSYGKNRPPVDFNRDWRHNPHWKAVKLTMEAIRQSAAEHDYCLFLDLHSPSPGGPSYLVPTKAAAAHKDPWAELWRLGGLLEAAAPSSCPVKVADCNPGWVNWEVAYNDCVATQANTLEHGVTAATIEIAYHLTSNGKVVGPDAWRALGRSLPDAIDQWQTGRDLETRVARPLRRFKGWREACQTRAIEFVEEPPALVLEPQAEDNSAAVEQRSRQPLTGGRAKLTLVVDNQADEPVKLHLRVLYQDERQLRVLPNHEPPAVVEPGVHELRLDLEPPAGAVAFRLSVGVARLVDRLVLRES